MTRIRTKHSIFCQKKPRQQGVRDFAIFLKDDKQWVVGKGKLYLDGRCRYWYNGLEGVVQRYNYQDITGLNEQQVNEIVVNLNLRQLEYYHPKPKKVEPEDPYGYGALRLRQVGNRWAGFRWHVGEPAQPADPQPPVVEGPANGADDDVIIDLGDGFDDLPNET